MMEMTEVKAALDAYWQSRMQAPLTQQQQQQQIALRQNSLKQRDQNSLKQQSQAEEMPRTIVLSM